MKCRTVSGIAARTRACSLVGIAVRNANRCVSCVMFVIDNASGNRIILTHGDAEAYFTDQRMSDMKSALKPYLSSGDMLNASYEFADKTQEFYDEGIPSDGTHNNHVEGTETADDKLKRENKLLYVLKKWGWLMGLIAIAAGGIFAGVSFFLYQAMYLSFR